MLDYNPAATESLVQLMWGALLPGREGGLLNARLRYFDPERRRAGVPEDVVVMVPGRRDGHEAGFPAFNVADSAICVGVGLLFILSWQNDGTQPVTSSSAKPEIRSSPPNAEMSSSSAVNSAATARNPTAYRK